MELPPGSRPSSGPQRPATGDSITSLSDSLGHLLKIHVGPRLLDEEMEALMSLRPGSEDIQREEPVPSACLNSQCVGLTAYNSSIPISEHKLLKDVLTSNEEQNYDVGASQQLQQRHEGQQILQIHVSPARSSTPENLSTSAMSHQPIQPSTTHIKQQTTSPCFNMDTHLKIEEGGKIPPPPPQQQQLVKKKEVDTKRKGKKAGITLCQVDGCGLDLSADHIKYYYRRHRVCEDHMKSDLVEVQGQSVRYCQQCHKFHEILEFELNKRNCRQSLLKRVMKNQPNPQTTTSNPAGGEISSPPLNTITSDRGNPTNRDVAGSHKEMPLSLENTNLPNRAVEDLQKQGRQRVGKSPYSGGPDIGTFMEMLQDNAQDDFGPDSDPLKTGDPCQTSVGAYLPSNVAQEKISLDQQKSLPGLDVLRGSQNQMDPLLQGQGGCTKAEPQLGGVLLRSLRARAQEQGTLEGQSHVVLQKQGGLLKHRYSNKSNACDILEKERRELMQMFIVRQKEQSQMKFALEPGAWSTLGVFGQSTVKSFKDFKPQVKDTIDVKTFSQSNQLGLSLVKREDEKPLRNNTEGDVSTGLTDGMRDLGKTSDAFYIDSSDFKQTFQ